MVIKIAIRYFFLLMEILNQEFISNENFINSCRFKGSLYMVNWKPEDVAGEKSEIPKNIGFWGHKFEQYMKAGKFFRTSY